MLIEVPSGAIEYLSYIVQGILLRPVPMFLIFSIENISIALWGRITTLLSACEKQINKQYLTDIKISKIATFSAIKSPSGVCK